MGAMNRTRNTLQRRAVLNAIRALPGQHPTAAEVYGHVRADFPNLSLATVYRAVHALAQSGEILELHAPAAASGGVCRYDAPIQPHHHIVCRACGFVSDLPALDPGSILGDVAAHSGFAVDPHPIQFTGLCAACAKP